MKKTIIAAIALVALTTGATFAQRGAYRSPYNNRPAQVNTPNDEFREEMKIERLDALVGLSRKQERELHRIEDQYDQQMSRVRTTPAGLRQMKAQKQQAMLSVLTKKQRERLFAQQQTNQRGQFNPYGRRG